MFCLKTRLIIKVSKPNFVSFETSEYVKLGYGESIQQRGQQCAAVDDEGYRRRYADGQVASRDADQATELLGEVAGTREANLLSHHAHGPPIGSAANNTLQAGRTRTTSSGSTLSWTNSSGVFSSGMPSTISLLMAWLKATSIEVPKPTAE